MVADEKRASAEPRQWPAHERSTPRQLATLAAPNEADISELAQWVQEMSGPVSYLENSRRKGADARQLRGFWTAQEVR